MTKKVFIVSAREWNGACVTALSDCLRLMADGERPVVFTRGDAVVASRFTRFGIERLTLPLGGGLDFVSPVSLASYLRRAPEEDFRVLTFTFRDAAIAVKARRLLKGGKRMTVVCRPRYALMPRLSRQEQQALREVDLVELQEGFDREMAGKLFSSPLAYYPLSPARFPFEGGEEEGKPAQAPPASGVKEKKILYCGRVAEEKGLGELLSALARLDRAIPWRLVVAGVGSAKDYVSSRNLLRREEMADRVDWRGFFLNTRPLYEEADVVVLPKLPLFGESLVVAEAEACGRKIVVAREGVSLAESLAAALMEP